ncbi:MAG: hypothetical protein IT305_13665 [Chloroflexi bacterium]|nr:hypothetical protein [Chloroflexota bacterium]
MSDTTSHSMLRVILTIVGLNGLVLISWLSLTAAMGIRTIRSLGPPSGAIAGADWSSSLPLAAVRFAMPIALTILIVAAGKRVGRP